MTRWVQRLRGAIGVGLTWAAGWVPVGAVTGLLTGVALGLLPLGRIAANYALLFGVLGFVGGAIFSTVVSIAEGRRRFAQLSLPRFVAWGALGGLMLGGLAVTGGILGASFTDLGGAIIGGVATLLGAGSAAGTLVIARSADNQALFEEGEGVAHVRLTRDEEREVLKDCLGSASEIRGLHEEA